MEKKMSEKDIEKKNKEDEAKKLALEKNKVFHPNEHKECDINGVVDLAKIEAKFNTKIHDKGGYYGLDNETVHSLRNRPVKGKNQDNHDYLVSCFKNKTYGQNKMTEEKPTPWWIKFLAEMVQGFSLLLWAGAIACFIAYGLEIKRVENEGQNEKPSSDNLYLGIVLALVVFLTGCFSYYQGAAAEATMAGFKKMTEGGSDLQVYREGKIVEMPGIDLVPGDIVKMTGGNNCPADCLILEASDFEVDNSQLTGESEAQKRSPLTTQDAFQETENICFFGTAIEQGAATGLVIRTGDFTVLAGIARAALNKKEGPTTMEVEIEYFIHIISAIAVFLGVTFFFLSLFYVKNDFITSMILFIGIIVANVPEGLLVTVTIGLTLTAKELAKKNVLVKSVESVETLGAITTICSDKTGTLTQNLMTITNLGYDQKLYEVAIEDSEDSVKNKVAEEDGGPIQYDSSSDTFKWLLLAVNLNNTSKYVKEAGEGGKEGYKYSSDNVELKTGTVTEILKRSIDGSASEGAMLKFMDVYALNNEAECKEKFGAINVEEVKNNHVERKAIPFNSKNKWMVTVNDVDGDDYVIMKGAPERVLARCTHIMIDGKDAELTEDMKDTVMSLNTDMAKLGRRVLGVAVAKVDEKSDEYIYEKNKDDTVKCNFPIGPGEGDLSQGLTWVGLTGIMDPPRTEVPAAVLDCQSASIQVVMVTGDQPVTAKAIAQEVNILRENNVVVDTLEDIAEKAGCVKKGLGDLGLFEEKYGTDKFMGKNYSEWKRSVKGIVVAGSTLENYDQDDWEHVLSKDFVVFARTQPEQKKQIVEMFQTKKQYQHQSGLGGTVAVTGDGVNDSPALGTADAGMAMGSGSDVAKDVAKMVLMDDNFSSIVKGIEEGRLIFDNLKKSIAYTLSSNIPEITPFLAFILFDIPLPLETVMILCIDLGTDMLPAISLAYETAESDIMRKPPRDKKKDRLVTPQLVMFSYAQIGVMQATAGFVAYFLVFYQKFNEPAKFYYDCEEDSVFGGKYICQSDQCLEPPCELGTDYSLATESTYFSDPHPRYWSMFNFDNRNLMNTGKYWQSRNYCIYGNEGDWIDEDGDAQSCATVLGVPYNTRKHWLQQAQAAYLCTIVIVQWADVMICKTRLLSIIKQKFSSVMIAGLIEETILIILLVYVQPAFNAAFKTRRLQIIDLCWALPFFSLIFLYDELRKWYIRSHPTPISIEKDLKAKDKAEGKLRSLQMARETNADIEGDIDRLIAQAEKELENGKQRTAAAQGQTASLVYRWTYW